MRRQSRKIAHLHRQTALLQSVVANITTKLARTSGSAAGSFTRANDRLAACTNVGRKRPTSDYINENGNETTCPEFEAGKRKLVITLLMQPVRPPLCKMTGASTCTPLTVPVF